LGGVEGGKDPQTTTPTYFCTNEREKRKPQVGGVLGGQTNQKKKKIEKQSEQRKVLHLEKKVNQQIPGGGGY